MPLALPVDEDKPGVSMPPPLYFVLPLLVLLGVEWFAPTRTLPRPWSWLFGISFVVLGIVLNMAGAMTQRRAGTDFLPDHPSTKIVSTGVYSWTRNPMYLGFALITAGLALLANSWWALAAVPVGAILVQTQVIVREERYLERKFGAEYVNYKTRVRSWL